MSKPNLLYYFRGKDEIYRVLLDRLLDTWLQPLRELDPAGDPMREIADYIDRKLEMARDLPRESRLFAGEIMRGAPILGDALSGPLKALVDQKSMVIEGWIDAGRIAPIDPRHLIFAIWATTQHYADFDTQIRAVLGDEGEGRFNDAARCLERLFLDGLRPR
jgi:TetR/AcrR family transcriptional regulator